jgi:hypothetical protein
MKRKEIYKHSQWSYILFNAEYGTVTCASNGEIRDMMQRGLDNMGLPKRVDNALQELCEAIYEETGSLPEISISD